MKNFHLNHYEKAFANWLIDNHIRFITVDEQKWAAMGRFKIKSFDYLLYPSGKSVIVAEGEGRSFKGTSFEKLSGFECWVMTDDIEGLANWLGTFGANQTACFVFAYRIEKVDVDFDGRTVYDFDHAKYIFRGRTGRLSRIYGTAQPEVAYRYPACEGIPPMCNSD